MWNIARAEMGKITSSCTDLAVHSSGTVVKFYRTARRHIPYDNTLHSALLHLESLRLILLQQTDSHKNVAERPPRFLLLNFLSIR